MNPKTLLILPLVFAAVACGRGSSVQKSQQEPYEVVQEGSADGVTSTINAPGETPPPLTSSTITGTNIDTTTNFTLPNTATTMTDQPGTIASTLPQNSSGGMPSGYYPARRPRPKPQTAPATDTTTTTESPTTLEGPPTTDTTSPPPTDTTGTQG